MHSLHQGFQTVQVLLFFLIIICVGCFNKRSFMTSVYFVQETILKRPCKWAKCFSNHCVLCLYNLIFANFVTGKMYYCKLDELNRILYYCTTCDKKYKHSRSLYRHRKYECDQPPQFQCHFCEKNFKQKCNFKSHLTSVHNVFYE